MNNIADLLKRQFRAWLAKRNNIIKWISSVNLAADGTLTVGYNNGTLNRNETIEFINASKPEPVVPDEKEEKNVSTPITGIFSILSYIAGVILLLLSLFLIVYSRRQIKRSY